jgi:glycosyltransferase involved in cell wall biosynthesis
MATNLPVAATTFGGLPDLFGNGDGFFMCTTEDELVAAARSMLATETIATRDKVLGLSWRKAAEAVLEAIDSEVL